MQYRKKSSPVDAVQVTATLEAEKLPPWLSRAIDENRLSLHKDETSGEHYANISSPYGRVRVNAGNWIVRGERDELTLCNDQQFRQTHEPIDSQ